MSIPWHELVFVATTFVSGAMLAVSPSVARREREIGDMYFRKWVQAREKLEEIRRRGR